MSGLIITNTHGAFELREKRFYIPGCIVSGRCPKCGKTEARDLGLDYLSYPSANESEEVWFWCEGCDTEWPELVIIRIEVLAAESPDG